MTRTLALPLLAGRRQATKGASCESKGAIGLTETNVDCGERGAAGRDKASVLLLD